MRELADAAVGFPGLHHGGFGNAAGISDLAADLLDRGRQLFGRSCDRLHVVGSLLGDAGDLARQGLRGLGGAGQCGRRGFELDGGGRHVRHDGADGALEIIGKADQLGAAACCLLLALGFAGGGITLRLGHRLDLELLDRAGHLADLVLAAKAGQHDVEIARGELTHRLAHRNHRPRDAGAEQEGEDRTEQGTADGEHQHQLLGLPDRRFRFRFKALLLGDQIRLHGRGAAKDRTRRAAHLGDEIVDQLGIGDQLLQRFAIGNENSLGILQAGDDLVVHGIDRAQRVLDEFQPRQRAGCDRLIGRQHEIGRRCAGGLKLGVDLLGAELDRLRLGIGGIVADIIELVFQEIGLARELVLHQQHTVALGLEDLGEGRREVRKLLGQLVEAVLPRRRLGALDGLVDGVLQAGLGVERHLGVVFLAGDDEIFDGGSVAEQLAIDIAGEIGLRDAAPIRAHAR